MMQHIHYGDWTIEWERGDFGSYDIWISNQMRKPRMMSIEIHRYWVMTSLNLESGMGECHRLINEITDRQLKATMDEILSFHDKHRPRDTAKPVTTSSPLDEDNVPF